MSTEKQKHFIEKFQGDFKGVNGGCTINYSKTIQSLRDPICLAVYTYLSSQPPEWEINVKNIQSHFGMGRNKAYKALNDLMLIGLIHRKEFREQGKFSEYAYYLYLEPLP
jgi:hypothetical protein